MSNNVVGKVASVVTFDFKQWMKQPPKEIAIKTKKSKIVKEVVFPLFLDYEKSVKDPYWSDILKKAAIGKFPKSFSYKDNILIHRRGQKLYNLAVNEETTSNDIISFFKEYGNIYSDQDMKSAMNEYENHDNQNFHIKKRDKDENVLWTSFGKKIQQSMTYAFITKLKKEYKLSPSEVDQLTNVILTYISNKVFNKNNIIIDDSEISEIRDLFWDEEKRIFYANPEIKIKITKTGKKVNNSDVSFYDKNRVPNFRAEWDRYCMFLENKLDTALGKA